MGRRPLTDRGDEAPPPARLVIHPRVGWTAAVRRRAVARPTSPADEGAVTEGLAGVDRALDVMEKRLASSPFIAGEQFTLADVSYMPYLEYLAATPSFSHVADRPAVAKWWKTISARPSWQTAIGK